MTFRISELSIEGFRSFPNNVEIFFPSRLTVIYGKNGRGKSTIFDAISWLFNGDILRYQEYGNEWKRFKTTHTRSLFNPDKPSKVQCSFRNESDRYDVSVSRYERQNLKYSEELKKWFPGWQEDHLKSHMLCQHQLHMIAKAKGTERLAALAPMLDLNESQKAISEIKEKIKDLQQNKHELIMELNSTNLPDNTKLLELVRNKANEISVNAEIQGIRNICVAISPTENQLELEGWNEWAQQVETLLKRKHSICAQEIGRLKSSYNLNDYHEVVFISNDEIKRIEDTMSEVNEKLKSVLYLISDCNYNNLDLESDVTNVQELNATYEKLEAELIKLSQQYTNIFVDDLENIISDTERRIIEGEKKTDDLLSDLHQHEAIREDAMNSIKMVNDLLLKINNCRNVVLENQTWLNEHKNEVKPDKIMKLKNELEEVAVNSREKLEKLTSTNINREVLYSVSEDGSCPLCGKEYDSQELLNQAIEAKTRLWKDKYTEFSRHIQIASEELTKLHSLMIEKERRVQIIEQENLSIKSTDQRINNLVNQLQCLPGWNAECVLLLERQEFTAIQDIMVKHANERISSINVDIEDHKGYMDKLREHHLESKKKQDTIKKYQYEIKATQSKLEQIWSELVQLAVERDISIDEAKSHEIGFKLLMSELSNRLKLARQEQVGLQEKQQTLRQTLQENEFKWLMILNGRLRSIDKTLDIMAGFNEMLRSVDKSIKQVKHKDAIIKQLEKNSVDTDEAKIKLKWLREKQREDINSAIGPLSDRINALFEILSGFSIWKNIKTKAYVPNQRERTNLILSPKSPGLKGTVDTNSTFMFSMGEFSVLGMAIFLAQATELKNVAIGDDPQLNTLLLDDPIQELDCIKDDILTYLLCDISRERQVIVSTSNLEFANRLILSSRPIWERYEGTCGVIHLDKSDNYNPQVHHVPPEKWIIDQGIYLPKAKIG